MKRHTNFGDEIYSKKGKDPTCMDYAIILLGILVIIILIAHPHILDWADKMLYE